MKDAFRFFEQVKLDLYSTRTPWIHWYKENRSWWHGRGRAQWEPAQ